MNSVLMIDPFVQGYPLHSHLQAVSWASIGLDTFDCWLSEMVTSFVGPIFGARSFRWTVIAPPFLAILWFWKRWDGKRRSTFMEYGGEDWVWGEEVVGWLGVDGCFIRDNRRRGMPHHWKELRGCKGLWLDLFFFFLIRSLISFSSCF